MCSWGPLAVNVQARFLHGAAPSGSEATHRLKDKGWGGGEREKKPRKKVDLHGSSSLREQEDNRKRALAQAADGLNRKVNGKCKEHTNRGFRQTRGVYLKHAHTMFSQEENCSPAQIWNMAFKQSHWIQDRLQSEVAKLSLCLWTPPPPTQKTFYEKPAEFHDFLTRHHSLYWRDVRSSGRLSTLDVTKCFTGL